MAPRPIKSGQHKLLGFAIGTAQRKKQAAQVRFLTRAAQLPNSKEKLIVVQIVKKFAGFCTTRRIITVFTAAYPVPDV
jgi:hypothetical protein